MDGKYLRPFEQAVAETNGEKIEALIGLVTDGVQSAHTRRAYARAIRDFLSWYRETGQVGLSKAVVLRYVAYLRGAGMGASSVNQRLSAIRKLAQEAADNEILSDSLAQGIRRAKGIRQEGMRQGFWLAREQAQALLNAPDADTLKGLRDRAMLAVMVGCGLRRSEVASLTFAHIQQREGRWLVVDLVGKRGKVRSVPMPAWAKEALDAWASAAGLTEGPVFRNIRRGAHVGEPLAEVGISWIVKEYGQALGFPKLAAHDLRRTYAKLAHKGGADLEQLRLTLGHGSLLTTQRYLGTALDLENAPCDKLGLEL